MDALIIDGNDLFRTTIGELFTRLGYTTTLSENIHTAHLALQTRPFNLICVAQELEDGLGQDFAKLCREKLLIHNEAPIFLTTTSQLTNSFVKAALLSGVTEVLSKTNINALYDQLENFAFHRIINTTVDDHVNILYIEDDLDVAKETIQILNKTGAITTHFTGTNDVFSYLTHNPTDLLISDILVEGDESVLSLIHRIRTSYSIMSIIPILLITGSDNLSRRIEFYHVGINDYLVKPILDIELIAHVKNLLLQRQFLAMATRHIGQLQVTHPHRGLAS